MNNFYVTEIKSVISVKKDEFKEKCTVFGSDLKYNELIFHLSGESKVYLGDCEMDISENCVRFMPAGKYSRYKVERKQSGECIDVFFTSNRTVANAPFAVKHDDKRLGPLFKKLFSLWNAKGCGYLAKCMAILYEIIAIINEINGVNGGKIDKIAPAVSYIEEHFLDEQISSALLESLCGISYSYVKRLFVRRFGVPPKAFVIGKKIDYACDLLLVGRMKIGEIALMCGYSDEYFFSRQFKKYVGLSPLQYIKKSK